MYKYKTVIFNLDSILIKTDTIFDEALKGVPQEGGLLTESGILYDGVTDVLDKLKVAGYTLCICTSGSEIYTKAILRHFEITNHFSIIKSRAEGLTKDQQIKQILDETQSCSGIVVGDRTSDFIAANNAGCLSVGVTYGYGGNEYAQADFKATTPQGIYTIIEKINNLYYQVYNQIIKVKKKNKPLLVGINGVDTSGKTIFTKELANYIRKMGTKVETIHLDDFHNPSLIRYKDPDPIFSYIDNAFNLDYIESEILKPLKEEGALKKELTLLDLETDEFNNIKRYEIDNESIVLFEGVLLYREPVEQYFDLKIYLDISFEEVLKRAAERDKSIMGSNVIDKYQQKYIPIQKWYMEKYQPMEKSQIIINNENYNEPQIIGLPNQEELRNRKSRVELKIATLEDLDPIRKLHEEDVIKEMLGVTELPDENYLKGKNLICYCILNENKEFVGIVELFNISWKNRRAEVSITIQAAFRGKGYGYEAVEKIVDIGFREIGLNRIWLRVLEHNTQAIKCYENAGFLKEGICREESMRLGKFQNQIQMSILRNQWVQELGNE